MVFFDKNLRFFLFKQNLKNIKPLNYTIASNTNKTRFLGD